MPDSPPPETLAWLRQTAKFDGATTAQVLLHLLERVEALEQRPIPGTVELAAPTPDVTPVATDAELQNQQFLAHLNRPLTEADRKDLGLPSAELEDGDGIDQFAPEAAPVASDKELSKEWDARGTIRDALRAIYNRGCQRGAAQLLSLKKELERERLRLAACGVVAMADTPESAAKARDICPDFWSASLDDVIRQVDALMEARAAQPPAAQPTPPPATAGGLVERVATAIHPSICADPNLYRHEARAAIREVAAWMRESQTGYNAARWLEQEALNA